MNETLLTTPYLIRAIYEWCCDSGQTPHLVVAVDEHSRVPLEYVKDGEIVLNLSPDATRNLKIDNDWIRFSARFNGVSREISVPVGAVKGIFARESGQGLAFQLATQTEGVESQSPSPQGEGESTSKSQESSRGRSKLQVVK
ncbi:MAG: ClpXP protease specificity-enhancing factor [Burkholderiales bacterium]|nr:ClpXP protease specificity-enhancing factor [Burkholderiales bacterium]